MVYTIYDIARVAGVSKSSVSRVLNNQKNISSATREKVQRAIEQLNFQPNKLARGLSSGYDAIMILSRPTNTTMDNPFFSEIIQSISAFAEGKDFDVILQTSRNDEDVFLKSKRKINGRLIKGIIALSSPSDETIYEQLDTYDIPIVVIGKVKGHFKNVYSVDTNNYQDSYDLTQLLINHGHYDIACLHSPINYHAADDRLMGFIDCMEKNHIKVNEDHIINSGYTLESTYQSVKKLFTLSQLPTAILATDDLKVLSIYKYAYQVGISILNHVSIVGYCNPDAYQFLFPSLTRIEIPIRKLGFAASDLLFSAIEKKQNISKKIIIPSKKIIQ